MNTPEHLLACLNEECLEIVLESQALRVAKIADKTLRFGLLDRNIDNPEGPTNKERLHAELCDLFGVIEMMTNKGIIPCLSRTLVSAKKEKLTRLMDYAEQTGALIRSYSPPMLPPVQNPNPLP